MTTVISDHWCIEAFYIIVFVPLIYTVFYVTPFYQLLCSKEIKVSGFLFIRFVNFVCLCLITVTRMFKDSD